MAPERGPFLRDFSSWLETGHGVPGRRAATVRDADEFLHWYDVNHHDDVAAAARSFAEYGTPQQAASMRLLLQWLTDDR